MNEKMNADISRLVLEIYAGDRRTKTVREWEDALHKECGCGNIGNAFCDDCMFWYQGAQMMAEWIVEKADVHEWVKKSLQEDTP